MREGTAGAARARGLGVNLDDAEPNKGEPTAGVPTLWVRPEALLHTLGELAGPECARPFLLLDLFCLDDTLGGHESGRAPTLVYLLLRAVPYAELRVKVRVEGEPPEVPSGARRFANALAYERAASERCGVRFVGAAAGSEGTQAGSLPDDGPGDDDELELDLALPRALALESLLGVTVPRRAAAIRVLRAELLRVASHLSWYAAFVETIGATTPASYAAGDVRRALEVLHALGGARGDGVAPGGVTADLPSGWRATLASFLDEMRGRAQDYAELALTSPTVLGASKGVSPLDARVASSWAVTGPLLRSAGVACDLRKARPYSGYDQYAFQVPTGVHGDVYDRARVRLLEVQQSLSILAQCAERMPDGPLLADVPDGLVPGEAFAAVESSRGVSACYVASDGASLFVRHRTPAHVEEHALEGGTRRSDERAWPSLGPGGARRPSAP